MSFNARELPAPPEVVFATIADPTTYPSWLVGNSEIREVEPAWPMPGSKFHHRVGRWPASIADSTKVLELDPGRMLRLNVRARPLIRAIVTFRVVGDDRRCVVTIEEEPELRLIGNAVRIVMDPMTHARNQASLRQLDTYLIDSAVAAHPLPS